MRDRTDDATLLSALLRETAPPPRPPRPEPRHVAADLDAPSIQPGPRLRRRWLPWLMLGLLVGCTQPKTAKLGGAPEPEEAAIEAVLVDTVVDVAARNAEASSLRAEPRPQS